MIFRMQYVLIWIQTKRHGKTYISKGQKIRNKENYCERFTYHPVIFTENFFFGTSGIISYIVVYRKSLISEGQFHE